MINTVFRDCATNESSICLGRFACGSASAILNNCRQYTKLNSLVQTKVRCKTVQIDSCKPTMVPV